MLSLPRLTPETLQFVLLSFEGPDEYAMAGGLGVRMKELALELARQGFRTHLLFVGDPDLPGREDPRENLTLYRWCQWLSAYHRGGVYEAEESKLAEWNATLPGFVVDELVRPAAEKGVLTAVLAEEWHTAYSTCLALRPALVGGSPGSRGDPVERQQRHGLRPHRLGSARLLQPDHHGLPIYEARHVG